MNGLNGFLVVLSHSQDDFPLALFAEREVAMGFASTCPWDGMHYLTKHPFERDADTPIAIGVLEFKEGSPVTWTEVRCWEDEEAKEEAV